MSGNSFYLSRAAPASNRYLKGNNSISILALFLYNLISCPEFSLPVTYRWRFCRQRFCSILLVKIIQEFALGLNPPLTSL